MWPGDPLDHLLRSGPVPELDGGRPFPARAVYGGGTYAETTTLSAPNTAPILAGASATVAAAPIAGTTAVDVLDQLGLPAGAILVNGVESAAKREHANAAGVRFVDSRLHRESWNGPPGCPSTESWHPECVVGGEPRGPAAQSEFVACSQLRGSTGAPLIVFGGVPQEQHLRVVSRPARGVRSYPSDAGRIGVVGTAFLDAMPAEAVDNPNVPALPSARQANADAVTLRYDDRMISPNTGDIPRVGVQVPL